MKTMREALFECTDATIEEIACALGVNDVALRNWYPKRYSKEYRKARKRPNYARSKLGNANPMAGKFGKEHHNYIGRASDHKGYFTVTKPNWWTGPNRSKRVFEHHVVYCENNGLTEIPSGMHVHHIDHNPANSAPDNLQLVTPEEHKRIHLQNVSRDDE